MMSTSIFLARLIGPVMLVIGLAVFANQRGFRDMAEEFMASRALMFLSGIVLMPAGLAIVLTHNVWSADWRPEKSGRRSTPAIPPVTCSASCSASASRPARGRSARCSRAWCGRRSRCSTTARIENCNDQQRQPEETNGVIIPTAR